MGIPTSFDGYNGFSLHGRGRCVNNFTYLSNSSTKIFAPSSGQIGVIDSPEFDPITGRPSGNGLASSFDTSDFSVDSTQGVDGAVLECRNVVIPKRKRLVFRYAFLPYESHTSNKFNDFALLSAFKKGDLNSNGGFASVQPFHSMVLGQSLSIADHTRDQLDWLIGEWNPNKKFEGTLCWVASTGAFVATSQLPKPSVLLIDTIEIR